MLIAIGTATGEWSRLAFTSRTITAMVYLVLVGSIVGYSSYVYALKYLPVSTVSLYAYVNPVIAVVLGTLFLSEPFSMRIVFASALVFAGIAIVRSTPRKAYRQKRGKESGVVGRVGRVGGVASRRRSCHRPAYSTPPPFLPYPPL